MPELPLADWPIDLYWFCGTGHTMLVARELAKALRAGGARGTRRRLCPTPAFGAPYGPSAQYRAGTAAELVRDQ